MICHAASNLVIANCLAIGVLVLATGCEQSPDATTTSATQVAVAPAPRTTETTSPPTLPPEPIKIATHGTPSSAEVKAKAPARPKEITFDTIKFDMQKEEPFLRSMLTPQIEALNNAPVRIRGYILPSFQQTGIKQFVLVRDNLQCCFGPGAALYDCMVVDMHPGKTANYTVRPVTVTGTFAVQELLDPDGKHLAIYHLTGESVQ